MLMGYFVYLESMIFHHCIDYIRREYARTSSSIFSLEKSYVNENEQV